MPISLSGLGCGSGRISAKDGLSPRTVLVVTNDTGAAINDLHITSNNTHSDDPDLKIVSVHRQGPKGERGEKVAEKAGGPNETFTDADLTLSGPIAAGETFQIVIRFDGEFEEDEYLTVKATIDGARVVSEVAAGGVAAVSSGASGAAVAAAGGGSGCTQATEDAELQRMLALYEREVNDRRAQGWQAGDDAGYSDPGLGMHKVGNCADWAHLSWSALVVHRWACWTVEKIRARQHWTARSYHHFVRLTGGASGRVLYLDPWKTGKPDRFSDHDFECSTGWTQSVIGSHAPGAPGRDPNQR